MAVSRARSGITCLVRALVVLVAIAGTLFVPATNTASAAANPPHNTEAYFLIREPSANSCGVRYQHGNVFGHAYAKIREGYNSSVWSTSNPSFPSPGWRFSWDVNYPLHLGVQCLDVQAELTAWNGSSLLTFSTAIVQASGAWVEANTSFTQSCCWSIVQSKGFTFGADEQAIAGRQFPGF